MFDDVLFGWDEKRSRTVSNAYWAGAAFADGNGNFSMLHDAIYNEMKQEISRPDIIGRHVPSVVELKEAYAAGYIDHLCQDEADNRLKYLMRHVDGSAMAVMLNVSPALNHLQLYGLDSAEIMEAVLRQLLVLRDNAVGAIAKRKAGLFSWFANRKRARLARELHDKYLQAVPDADLSHAMALAALEFCKRCKATSPDEAGDWITAADYLRTASINVCHIDRPDTLAALEKVDQEADAFNERHASLA